MSFAEIRAEAGRRAEEILRAVRESTRSVEMNGGNVVLRYPTPAKQKDDTYDGEAYVDVTFYGLDNMLKALAHLALGQEQQVQSLLKFLQINGDGTRFCRYLNGEFKQTSAWRYRQKIKHLDDLNLEHSNMGNWYMTKAHALAAIIYTLWENPNKPSKSPTQLVVRNGRYDTVHVADDRAIQLLDQIIRKSRDDGLNYDAANDGYANTGRNIVYQYADTNTLIAIALAMSGHYELAKERLETIRRVFTNEKGLIGHEYEGGSHVEGASTFDYALVGIAHKALGQIEEASQIARFIEAQNTDWQGILSGIYKSPEDARNDAIGWVPEGLKDRESVIKRFTRNIANPMATAAQAILLNALGDKEQALRRLGGLELTIQPYAYESEWRDHSGETHSETNQRYSTMENILYVALAYADIARERSLFETGIIQGSVVHAAACLPDTKPILAADL